LTSSFPNLFKQKFKMNDCSLSSEFDVVIVGGGLQGALMALALLQARRDARVALIERDRRVGGNHTWSFHAGDVPEEARGWVNRLVAYAWQSYDVAFPGFERTIASPYAAISSERLAAVVDGRLADAPGSALLTSATVERIESTSVELGDGRRVRGRLVVDARGPGHFAPEHNGGYQKFVGLELALAAPHGRSRPTLMDARVAQNDGYRFFYVLPLDERRVLVEDTYFSDGPHLDRAALRSGILDYAGEQGFAVTGVVREEEGVLPLPSRGVPAPKSQSPLVAGYAGGWFHPATGYSFPVALRLALHIARVGAADPFNDDWKRLVAGHRAQFRFASLLNRMLFGAFYPAQRWHAMERFYRMPEPTIQRFYALGTTRGDQLKLLCGRPPRGISLRAAIGASP
jgi:lycopene beta-cyclase